MMTFARKMTGPFAIAALCLLPAQRAPAQPCVGDANGNNQDVGSFNMNFKICGKTVAGCHSAACQQ